RAVRDFDAFAGTAEIHGVVADDIAAAYYREADAAGFTRAGFAVASPVGDVGQIFAPGVGDRFAHGQRRSRGRVDLVAMVGLEDFDVVTAIEQTGRHFKQLERDVHADTHVRCEHDGSFLGRGLDGLLAGFIETGGADHAFHAVFDAGLQMPQGGLRAGEIDQAVGVGECRQIVGDGDAGVHAEECAGVLADRGRIGPVQGDGQCEVFAVEHGFDE